VDEPVAGRCRIIFTVVTAAWWPAPPGSDKVTVIPRRPAARRSVTSYRCAMSAGASVAGV
jgi:hypothetical protein